MKKVTQDRSVWYTIIFSSLCSGRQVMVLCVIHRNGSSHHTQRTPMMLCLYVLLHCTSYSLKTPRHSSPFTQIKLSS